MAVSRGPGQLVRQLHPSRHPPGALRIGFRARVEDGPLGKRSLAFLSVDPIEGELATGRLRALRVRGLRIVRHFHLIHRERRRPSAAARAFMELLAKTVPGQTPRRANSRGRSE